MRRVLSHLLVFLLLVAQQAQWHALQHRGQRPAGPDKAVVSAPAQEISCPLCDLLAAGSAAVPASEHQLTHPDGAGIAQAAGEHSRTAEPPAYYRSRAPPALS